MTNYAFLDHFMLENYIPLNFNMISKNLKLTDDTNSYPGIPNIEYQIYAHTHTHPHTHPHTQDREGRDLSAHWNL